MAWRPEIMYENDDGLTGGFPFIPVPADEKMPSIVYIFESRETGETEQGHDGELMPVVQMDLHQYADMSVLRSALSPEHFDSVRVALGLEPLADAVRKGEKITQSIQKNLE